MLNKKNISAASIILSVIIVGIIIAAIYCISVRVYSFYGNRIEKVSIGNNVFYSEVVSNVDKMHKGLGGRNGLCQSCAMLFQFSSPGKYTFWMKDMHFPLDIIWALDGKVVYIEKNVSENFPSILIPSSEADQVMEINAGNAEKMDIKVGDEVMGK